MVQLNVKRERAIDSRFTFFISDRLTKFTTEDTETTECTEIKPLNYSFSVISVSSVLSVSVFCLSQ
jgi:hypothetical protein